MRHFGCILLIAALTGCVGDRDGDRLAMTGHPVVSTSPSGPTPGVSTIPSPVPSTGTSPAPAVSPNTTASPAPATTGNLCAGGFAVCDDFENLAPGMSPNATWWTVQTQNAAETITVDASRAYSGAQSLHIHTSNSGYERAVIVNKTAFPAANNTFFGRIFFYLEGNQPQTHFNLVDAAGTLAGQSVLTDVVYGGQSGMFLANYYNASNPQNILDLWQHAGTPGNGGYTNTTAVPTNRWACLEWQFKGPTNEMHMWLDGNAIDSMTLVGIAAECCQSTTWTQPPFSQVALGWTIVANKEAFDHFDYWLDAVALDTKRIGCTP